MMSILARHINIVLSCVHFLETNINLIMVVIHNGREN